MTDHAALGAPPADAADPRALSLEIRDLEEELFDLRCDNPVHGPVAVAAGVLWAAGALYSAVVGFPESDLEWVLFTALVVISLAGLAGMLTWMVRTYRKQLSLTRRIGELKALARASDRRPHRTNNCSCTAAPT